MFFDYSIFILLKTRLFQRAVFKYAPRDERE